LIFENPGTTIRKKSDSDYWILQFWENPKGKAFLRGKRLSWRVDRKIIKKMERFPECSLFKYRQCEEKVNRVGYKRRSGLRYNNSKIKT